MDIDISPTGLMVMIFFSLVGIVYIRRGKSEGPTSHIIYGIVLLLYPYFVTDLLSMLIVGVAILAMSYFLSFG